MTLSLPQSCQLVTLHDDILLCQWELRATVERRPRGYQGISTHGESTLIRLDIALGEISKNLPSLWFEDP